MIQEIRLPEISENVNEAEVVKVLVKVGDQVAADQPVVECETSKAIFEVPSPVAGKITEIVVKENQTIHIGDVIGRIETEAEDRKPETGDGETGKVERGTGNEETDSKKQIPEPETPSTPTATQDIPQSEAVSEPVSGAQGPTAPAAPSVRRFAREIGLDIHRVPGSGPNGRISIDDVKSFAKRILRGGGAASSGTGIPIQILPDLSKWGPIRREPMTKIRQVTSENMASAWITVPLVTQNDRADITDLEKARKELSPKIKEAGGKLTITAILVKVAAAALKDFPKMNAVPDAAASEIVYRDYIHIGVAVDTERGLLVPVIRDADQKSLLEICKELPNLAEKARSKKLMPDALEGGCFSISNLGGFGVSHFTPLVSGPQVGILGVGGAKEEAVYRDGAWVPHLMLPLSLSYDHRLIDGADGARFIHWVAEALENPFALALEGGF